MTESDLLANKIAAVIRQKGHRIDGVEKFYRQWIHQHRESLSGLNEAISSKIISDIVEEKISELANSDHDEVFDIIKIDKVEMNLDPIDKWADTMAERVHNGLSISKEQKNRAGLFLSEVEAMLPPTVTSNTRKKETIAFRKNIPCR